MSTPGNITVIIPYKTYPPVTGGQKFNALTYKYLSGILPVTVISTNNNVFPTASSCTYLSLLGNSKLRYINPFLFFSIRKTLLNNNASHIIFIHPYFGWLGILLKTFTKKKLVIQSHNIEALRFKSVGKWWWKILWHYEKYTHSKADINFFVTEEDRQYGIVNYKLSPVKCHILTYGCEIKQVPSPEEKSTAANIVRQRHGIAREEKILLFNGALDYKPNVDAIDYIVNNINPLLLKETGFRYKMVICGKGLPAAYDNLTRYKDQHVIFAGFVDDISEYFKAADIFINPVIDGGGIKTKLVEALGYNVSSVSSINGAFGVNPEITSGKLVVIPNGEWQQFAKAIVHIDCKRDIGKEFFSHFYWENIAATTAAILNK